MVRLYQTDKSHTLSEFLGVETDSKKLYKSHLLDDLEEIAVAHGQDFVAFGDSAFPIHRFFQHVLKCPKGGSLTRPERLFNALKRSVQVLLYICSFCGGHGHCREC